MREELKFERLKKIYDAVGNGSVTMEQIARKLNVLRQNIRREVLEMVDYEFIEVDETKGERPVYYKKVDTEKEFNVTEKQFMQRKESSKLILKLLFKKERTINELMLEMGDVTVDRVRQRVAKLVSDEIVVVTGLRGYQKVYKALVEEFTHPKYNNKTSEKLIGSNARTVTSDDYHVRGTHPKRSAWIGSSSNI